METRAHHLLIGTFMLVFTAGLVAFVIWLAKVDVDQQYKQYRVYFEGSVAGLNEGSAVRLNGIPVGSVLDMSIPRADPSRVRVLIRIESSVPIREGSTARLELQGFTGLAFLQISGGQGDEEIVPREGEEIPEIPSERSPIQQVFEEAPNLINEAILAVANIKDLLNADNRAAFGALLRNLETLTAAAAGRSDEFGRAIAGLDETLSAIRDAAESWGATARTTGEVVDRETRRAMSRLGDAAAALESAADEIEGLTSDVRPGMDRFSNRALPEAEQLLRDLRELSDRLSRLAETIEDRPGETIFGGERREYRPGGDRQ